MKIHPFYIDIASEIAGKGRFAIIVPVYNHGGTVGEVIHKSLLTGLPVVVIDDGSTDSTPEKIGEIVFSRQSVRFSAPMLTVVRHPGNKGKGAALRNGMETACEFADWAISVDADGQHDPLEIIELIRAIPKHSRPIVIGKRKGMDDNHVPWTSRFGRKFSNFWVRMSGGPKMLDSQSGFRIYPLPETLNLKTRARRFQYEIEVLVRAHRRRIEIVEVPVSVIYPQKEFRISHFRPFIDFMRNFKTFMELIVERLLILPFLPKHDSETIMNEPADDEK